MTHKGVQVSSGGARDLFTWVFDPSGLVDTDGDGVLDSAPNCPTVPNSDKQTPMVMLKVMLVIPMTTTTV